MSEHTSQLQFTTFGAVAEINGSQVTIPDDRRADFQAAATYFSHHTNRAQLKVTMGTEDDAKLLVRQLKQWAESHDLSTSPKRDGASVQFRFAHKRAENRNGPVTVSHVGDN